MKTLLGLAIILGSASAAAAQGYGYGSRSPYTSGNGIIVDQNGTYRGNANGNPYDPNSVSNPMGRYGSRTSPDSLNNPTGPETPTTATSTG